MAPGLFLLENERDNAAIDAMQSLTAAFALLG